MKKFPFAVILLLACASCKNQTADVNSVKFPPPVIKTDVVLKAPPAEKKYDRLPNASDEASDKITGNVASQENVVKAKLSDAAIKDTSKKITKEGDISFETKDLAATRKALLSRLKELGGYADEDNESVNSDDDRKEFNLKVRIPARNFDLFLDSVSVDAVTVDSKHISISDVTTQYIDMTTRLQNQKILESTYISLLKRASKMSDVLEVEDKLTDTRSEIESEQGQLNYLSRQIAFSSLDITFYTKQVPHEAESSAGYQFRSSVSNGWTSLQSLFFGLIALWPFLLFLVTLVIVIRRWRKRRRFKAAQ